MSDWDIVNTEIERSKIQRINWKKILGCSLTKAILELKKEGLTSDEAYIVLKDGTSIKNYLQEHFSAQEKILHNLYISVHARYGEQNTASKILGF